MQNVLEMAVLGVNAGQETYLLTVTYSLTYTYLLTYLVSQTIDDTVLTRRAVKRRNSAIFKMKIFIH